MMRWHIFKGARKVAIISFDLGNLSATYFDDAARCEIDPLLEGPIEHEVGEPVYKGGVLIGAATGWGRSEPGTEGHFIALNHELIMRGYSTGLEEGIQEQAATA